MNALTEHIKREGQHAPVLLTEDGSNLGMVLAEAHDILQRFDMLTHFSKVDIQTVYAFEKHPNYDDSLVEYVKRGYATLYRKLSAVNMLDHIKKYLAEQTPDGYTFEERDHSIGWFPVPEEVNFQQVRTYMHGLAPVKQWNRASVKDDLYMLETLYTWRDTGIPVPQKYIDYLKGEK